MGDDAQPLMTLRRFRDTYMQSTPDLRKEVDTYYRIAPDIVAGIEACRDAAVLWKDLANNFILPAVRLIEGSEPERAHQLYRRMVRELSIRFLPHSEPGPLNGCQEVGTNGCLLGGSPQVPSAADSPSARE